MRTQEIKSRIENLEHMLQIYMIIYNDKKSHLYQDELIKSFIDKHTTELEFLKIKLIYNKEVTV